LGRYTSTKYRGVFTEQSKSRRFNGRPDVCFYAIYKDGNKRKWEKIGFASEGYNAAKANEIRVGRIRASRGHDEAPNELTLGEARERLLKYKLNIKHHAYFYEYNKYLKHLDNIKLTDIKTSTIMQIRDSLINRKLKISSIKYILSMIKAIFNFCIKQKLYFNSNPVVIDLPKEDNKRQRFLTKEEANKILTALRTKSPYIYSIAFISLNTGMRLSEVITLKGSNIDLNNGIITIFDTKNSKNRSIYMNKSLKEFFNQQILNNNEYVFKTKHTRPDLHVSSGFKKAIDELGLNDGITDSRQRIVFHTLRHTFASWMVMAGQSLYLVGTILGHSSIQMTQRYAHLAPETQRAAMATFDNLYKLDKPTE
jgi:integrase